MLGSTGGVNLSVTRSRVMGPGSRLHHVTPGPITVDLATHEGAGQC